MYAVFSVYRIEERRTPLRLETESGTCALFEVRHRGQPVKVVETFEDGTTTTIEYTKESVWFDTAEQAEATIREWEQNGVRAA